MHKETIVFTDFNGKERKEDHYFNLTKAELIKLQMGIKGGLVEHLSNAIQNEDSPVVIEVFEKLIRTSYGRKNADGIHFDKSPELFEAFESSPAYSELFVKLLTDDDASDRFMRGVIPAEMAASLPANIKDALPEELKETLAIQE